jgi:hypothetical protein
MVKSESLFAYIAPMNVFGWLLAPLRYMMTFRQFVKLNRTLIKLTHVPMLFSIWAYESLVLSRHVYEPTDLVEQRGRHTSRQPAFILRGPGDLFSPGARLREPSVTTFHKDRALEEVFRQPFRAPSDIEGRRDDSRHDRQRTNIVHDWMRGVGHHGPNSPIEQAREELDKLETRRPGVRRSKTAYGTLTGRRGSSVMAPSAISDPEENRILRPRQYRTIREEDSEPNLNMGDMPQQTDQDGDDELATNDEDDGQTFDQSSEHDESVKGNQNDGTDDVHDEESYFQTPTTAKARTPLYHTAATRHAQSPSPVLPEQEPTSPSKQPRRRGGAHTRTTSSATILFAPLQMAEDDRIQEPSLPMASSPPQPTPVKRASVTSTARNSGNERTSGTATPRRNAGKRAFPGALTPLMTMDPSSPARPQPFLHPQRVNQSTPNLAGFLALDRRRPSFNAVALDLASDLGDNRVVPDLVGAFPASFGTQLDMSMAAARQQQQQGQGRNERGDGDTTRRLNKLMLARMEKMELGFQEVLREVKGLSKDGGSKSAGASRAHSSVEGDTTRNVVKGKARRGKRAKVQRFAFGSVDSGSSNMAESPGAMTDGTDDGGKFGLPSTSV